MQKRTKVASIGLRQKATPTSKRKTKKFGNREAVFTEETQEGEQPRETQEVTVTGVDAA